LFSNCALSISFLKTKVIGSFLVAITWVFDFSPHHAFIISLEKCVLANAY
jgi:hypothetical protein